MTDASFWCRQAMLRRAYGVSNWTRFRDIANARSSDGPITDTFTTGPQGSKNIPVMKAVLNNSWGEVSTYLDVSEREGMWSIEWPGEGYPEMVIVAMMQAYWLLNSHTPSNAPPGLADRIRNWLRRCWAYAALSCVPQAVQRLKWQTYAGLYEIPWKRHQGPTPCFPGDRWTGALGQWAGLIALALNWRPRSWHRCPLTGHDLYLTNSLYAEGHHPLPSGPDVNGILPLEDGSEIDYKVYSEAPLLIMTALVMGANRGDDAGYEDITNPEPFGLTHVESASLERIIVGNGLKRDYEIAADMLKGLSCYRGYGEIGVRVSRNNNVGSWMDAVCNPNKPGHPACVVDWTTHLAIQPSKFKRVGAVKPLVTLFADNDNRVEWVKAVTNEGGPSTELIMPPVQNTQHELVITPDGWGLIANPTDGPQLGFRWEKSNDVVEPQPPSPTSFTIRALPPVHLNPILVFLSSIHHDYATVDGWYEHAPDRAQELDRFLDTWLRHFAEWHPGITEIFDDLTDEKVESANG